MFFYFSACKTYVPRISFPGGAKAAEAETRRLKKRAKMLDLDNESFYGADLQIMTPGAKIRVSVTGSRGKSGVVRLLHSAFAACGLNARSRITGVLPRELTPWGEIPLLRPFGASVAETKWWLSSLPADTEAITAENNAVSPDLQFVCPRLLVPTATVLTNIRPDHRAFWGESEDDVAEALSGALPRGGQIILPEDVAARPPVLLAAEKKKLTLHAVRPLNDGELPPYLRVNMALALRVCELHGLDARLCLGAMRALPPDIADSRLLRYGEAELAFAFSINDEESTAEYFSSLGWRRKDTTLIYNHREDRADRLYSFMEWIRDPGWRKVVITGDRPGRSLGRLWKEIGSAEEFAALVSACGQSFGCGNVVYGFPLLFKLALEEGKMKIGI